MAKEPGLGDRLKGTEEAVVWGAIWVPACVSMRLGEGRNQNTVHPRNNSGGASSTEAVLSECGREGLCNLGEVNR